MENNAARDEKAKGAAAPNEDVLVWVGGGLVPRDMAKVCCSRSGYGAVFRRDGQRVDSKIKRQLSSGLGSGGVECGAFPIISKLLLYVCSTSTRARGRKHLCLAVVSLPGAPKVSVFDSSVQGGDAVWEGIRVYRGKVFCLDRCVYRCRLFSLPLSLRSGIPWHLELEQHDQTDASSAAASLCASCARCAPPRNQTPLRIL